MKGVDIKLHGIIVTHPDGDHMNGIKKLLEKHGQKFFNKCDIVTTKAFYWTSRDKPCEDFMKLIHSAYSMRDDIEVQMSTCLRPGLNCYFPTEMGCVFRCTPKYHSDNLKGRRTQQSEIYPKPNAIDANATSILTVINESKGKYDVVLTGDSNAKEILPLVQGKEIRIFQVPHHGSSYNSRLEDSVNLKEISALYDLSTIHDKEMKETLLFYGTFRAHCYLISAGGTESYKHPHPQVMQGIILANAKRHRKCIIVLTNSRGLDSKKLRQLHQLASNWTQWVQIYHYDDVFFTNQCHITLRPERCISDACENTVEWTPKGYINRTKIILPVKLTISDYRPLERNRFTEKSTVEITVQEICKFNAHIICVPLPHNPRSGDSINCCYVIEESIASEVDHSKALFLLNGDEKLPLSRAKKHILTQYINNEWQKKQLPATLKDISSQASPCKIPYDVIDSLWPVQERPSQATPLRTPHQPLRPVPDFSESSQPHPFRHTLHQSLRPVLGSSPQSSPSHTPQPHHVKMVACQGVGGTPTRRCGCRTGCNIMECGCMKRGLYCGPSCQCGSECINNLQPAISLLGEGRRSLQTLTPHHQLVSDSSPQSSLSHTPQPHHVKMGGCQGAGASTIRGCGCKTGCNTKKCGCMKRGSYCGPSCQCGSECINNLQPAIRLLEEDQLRVMPDKMKKVEVKVGSPSKGCGCQKGCGAKSRNNCGCKKKGLRCGPGCKCTNTYFNCENQ